MLEEGEHLHGEGLVELEETDVVDRQAGLGQGLLRGGDGAVAHDLGLDADDSDKVNRYGGAIATGHPLASSGVRLMTQLSRQFAEDPSVRYGMTAMCIGIGMGGAVIWENPHHADYGKEN